MRRSDKYAAFIIMKDISTYLAGFTYFGIKADLGQFTLSFTVFLLGKVADFFMLNHLSTNKKEQPPP